MSSDSLSVAFETLHEDESTLLPLQTLKKFVTETVHVDPEDEFVPVGEQVRAQLDTGAHATCTDQLDYLHDYISFDRDNPCPVRLMPATQGSDAVPHGYGYLHVPYGDNSYISIKCFYHPKLRTTVIDERDIVKGFGYKPKEFKSDCIEKFHDHGTFVYKAIHRMRTKKNVYLDGILRNGKCYSHPLIPVLNDANINRLASQDISMSTFKNDCEQAIICAIHLHQTAEYAKLSDEMKHLPCSFHHLPFHEYIQRNTPIHSLKAATERMLWHQRLGHPSDHYLYNAHKHVDGVPQFRHETPVLETCPTCIRAKQTKEPAGKNTTRVATIPYQGLSVDFSFSGTKSKDKQREADYLGLKGETCWILITDHFTRVKHGDTRKGKASPIHWLRHFLETYSPKTTGKYVYMDQGGELFKNPEVVQLFKRFGYDVKPTGADASNQNGPVERGHLTVANAVRALLIGSGLDIKFWPYAFHHWLRIDNAIPSRDQKQSPLEMATNKKDNFRQFRTFGCRVWVRPPGRRSAKFKSNSRKGIFLGYVPNTTKNILWYDPETNTTKIAKHARFDEGMNDLPPEDVPPNIQHLQRIQDGQRIPSDEADSEIEQFTFVLNPFSHTIEKEVKVKCKRSNFGLTIGSDECYNRAFIANIAPKSTVSPLRRFKGACVTQINGEEVFSQE